MTDQITTMMAAAQLLIERAATDPALAEALLADAGGEVARESAAPLPEGALFTAARNGAGEVELSLDMPAQDGEIDDALLDGISAGRSRDEPGRYRFQR